LGAATGAGTTAIGGDAGIVPDAAAVLGEPGRAGLAGASAKGPGRTAPAGPARRGNEPQDQVAVAADCGRHGDYYASQEFWVLYP
jgi:hypothetical protein